MSNQGVTKDQVTLKLKSSISTFTFAVSSSKDIKSFDGLPNAFPVVTRHLPVLLQVLGSIERYYHKNSDDKLGTENERYSGVYQFASMCQEQAGYLREVFSNVADANNVTAGLNQYRKIASEHDNQTIESVMGMLLKRAMDVAVEHLVGEDLIEQLRSAKKEVDTLESSLGNPQGFIVLNNSGPGSQFLHKGAGDQNHCTGGIQITGRGTTNHIGSPWAAQVFPV